MLKCGSAVGRLRYIWILPPGSPMPFLKPVEPRTTLADS